MLQLRELQRAMGILHRRLTGSSLQRIVQSDDFRLILEFRTSGSRISLLLSCRPDFARVSVVSDTEPAPSKPPSFAQLLRASLGRASFTGATVSEQERTAHIRLRSRDEEFEILLSVLGARSNIYFLGAGRVLHAMRPLEKTRRDLTLGGLWSDPSGGPPATASDRWESIPDVDYLEAIEKTYAPLEQKREVEDLLRRMEGTLRKEQDYQHRKLENLRRDLDEAAGAQEQREKGELLKTVLHTLRPGDDSVSVVNPETGNRVSITLDPLLSPAQNLEAYFIRYQKGVRGMDHLQRQIDSVQGEAAEIEELRERVERLSQSENAEHEAVLKLAHHPRLRKLLKHAVPARKTIPATASRAAKKGIPSRLLPKRFRGEHGLEIWVGRSDEGNDYLTTRLARGNDLFFHLEGYPGSHVVLRTEGRGDPPPDALLDACELAVHFSRLKDANRADVHVASIKNVRKPRGAKPGLVYVSRGKTIHLRRSPKRLQNILASRTDE